MSFPHPALGASLFLAGLALGTTGSGEEPPSYRAPVETETKPFDEMLEEVRSEFGVPALAAACVRPDGTVAAAAVGFQRIDRDLRVRLADRFHIGSVSKPVTSTVLAILVEERALQWESTVAEWFPDLAGRIRPEYLEVTLADLLSHRGGIVPWEEDEEIALAPVTSGTARERRRAAIEWILSQPPVAVPGSEHVYSNAGYMIAAVMAEEATGTAWETLVVERLADPLGLSSLGFGWPARVDSSQPWGHFSSPGGFVPHDPHDAYEAGPFLVPAGDVHMDIRDLARFAQVHLEGLRGIPELLTVESIERLHRPIDDYALGWNVRETADHHLGGMGTFLAAIWISVPRKTAIVVATNADADEGIISEVINGTLRTFRIPKPE